MRTPKKQIVGQGLMTSVTTLKTYFINPIRPAERDVFQQTKNLSIIDS